MNASRLPLWARAALVGLAVVALIGWVMAARRGATARLSDGRELAVIAVTYGTNHSLDLGRPWFQMLRPFLSPPRAYRLGLRSFVIPTDTPSMLVWVQCRNFPADRAPVFLTVVDRHGVESEPIQPSLYSHGSTNQPALLAWRVSNFPRTQREVHARFYQPQDSSHLQRVAELPVRNPARVPALEPVFPPPPVVVGRDGREFGLLGLKVGEPPLPSLQGTSFQMAPWTTARLGVREGENWSASWTIMSLEASSAAGNRFARPLLRTARVDHQILTAFQDFLWADDPDWTLRMEFMPTRDFQFPPQEVRTFSSLLAQLGRPPFLTNLQAVVNGVELRSLQIAGNPGLARREPEGYRRTTEVTLRFTSGVPRVRAVLIRVADDRGRELKFGDAGEESPGKFVAGLELRPETRLVDLTFAFHRSEIIEFKARAGGDPAGAAASRR